MTDPSDTPPRTRGPKRVFRPASDVRLTSDEAKREGRAIRLALDGLGVEAAQLFLNSFNSELGGRPLAVATQSDAGSSAVAAAIASRRR